MKIKTAMPPLTKGASHPIVRAALPDRTDEIVDADKKTTIFVGFIGETLDIAAVVIYVNNVNMM